MTFHLTDDVRRALIESAQATRQNAYAPYSHYHVGAALLDEHGKIHTGCNVENAAYSPTICAERTALVKAISEGVRQFSAVAVVTENGGSPCGTCRQTLYEFGPDMLVIIADAAGNVLQEMPLSSLLPFGFGPAQLVDTNKG